MSICLDSGSAGVAAVHPGGDGSYELLCSECLSLESPDAKVDVVNNCIRKNGLQKKHCVSVLPTDAYQLIQADIEGVEEGERREAARWQIRERIDYPPEEAVIDLFDVESFSGDRKPLTYVVSSQKDFLSDLATLVQECDLKLGAIDIPEFALRNVASLFTEDARGVAILLLLEEKGILVVAREGVLYLVRLFNTGMNDLLPFADGDYESLSEALDGIVLEIQRSFDFCESTFSLPMVSRLLVAQTVQEIPAIVSYLNEYLGTTVEPFNLPKSLKIMNEIDPLVINRNLLAIGGALRQEAE